MPGGVEICTPSDPQIPLNANAAAADFDDFDSACSTPYVSAPSSPGRCPPPGVGFFYYSAPTSPVHFILSTTQIKSSSTPAAVPPEHNNSSSSFEFELHALAGSTSSAAGSMSSADELFLNGQIRPMKLSSHLQRPQAPLLLDLDPHRQDEDDDDDDDKNANTNAKAGRGRDSQMMLRDRSKSLRRRARSKSPLRSGNNNNSAFPWLDNLVVVDDHDHNQREGEVKDEEGGGRTRKDPVQRRARELKLVWPEKLLRLSLIS